jgi:alkylhydroperoxidase/carboxymuconolactone decarboxylase family protein YurZ
MSSMTEPDLPAGASRVAERHAAVWRAYEGLGAACSEAGPLDDRTRRLVKLALAIGAASEGAVHSHVRRALAEAISVEELEHVVLLAIPTLGFPRAVAALTWIDDVTKQA